MSKYVVDSVPVAAPVVASVIAVVVAVALLAAAVERFAVELYPVEWWIDFVWPVMQKKRPLFKMLIRFETSDAFSKVIRTKQKTYLLLLLLYNYWFRFQMLALMQH